MSDRQVQEAFHHWMPRFIANGIDYNDLQRMMPKFESWDDWCRVWSEQGAVHEALADEAIAAGHNQSAADAYVQATMYYHFANAIYYRDYDQKEAAHRKKVDCYAKAAPLLDPPSVRIEVPFEDTSLPAYFRTPAGDGPFPCVIMVPGLDSVKEQEFWWEEMLLKRGMATLSFDGPGQGEMWFRQKMRLDYEVAVTALVDWLQARDEIDSERIGLLGHSLGGYFGARAAAHEKRLAAAVLLAGFYAPRDWSKMSVFSRTGMQHIYGAATSEEASEMAGQMTLEGVADKITCPIMVLHGSKDTLIADSDAHKLANDAQGPVDLVIYPDGNHVMNNYVYKMRPQVVDWLMDQLVG